MLAGALTIVVALLHLGHETAGFPRFVLLVSTGQPLLDPRPITFTIAGVGLIIGVLATWNGFVDRQWAYRLGIAMMVAFMAGYVLWHLTGHGSFWPYRPGSAELHPGNPIVIIVDHLRIEHWALASKTAELAAVIVLSYVYVTDVRRG